MRRFAASAFVFRSVLLVFALGIAAFAHAQVTLGSVNGTVLDPSGAAIPGSTITVSDPDIGVTRTTTSQGNGFFQVVNLPIGTYKIVATHDGFDTENLSNIQVQEARATTVSVSLKVGQTSTSVDVTANPLLNATDATNGYILDSSQIAETPLATGSFTQLAVLSPGANAELLSGVDTNAGLGNQPIWANGQRDTSNTYQVDGVDSTNIFNGKTSSNASSQRYQFNIGQGTAVGGETSTSGSVYGSNGNSLPTPPPEFIQELRVNTSMYDAQQGATSGAQIDASTATGTNHIHGQAYGSFANNAINADPYFFKQDALLAQSGVGAFPSFLAKPALHRWVAGGTVGGPIIKDKLFYFLGYQHTYGSDQSTGISQLNSPLGLTNDRSTTGITSAEAIYNNPANPTLPTGFTLNPIALALLQATVPQGGYLIPTPQTTTPYNFGTYNTTLVGTSILLGDQATASVDWDVTHRDRLSFKYYYQNDPLTRPFGESSYTFGFPGNTYNGAKVGAIDNTITIGPRINWEQRLGYVRMGTYSSYSQNVINNSGTGPTFGISNATPGINGIVNLPNTLPNVNISEIINPVSTSPSMHIGPYSNFANTGYYQNRLNPSSNIIFTLGKHTIVAGGGYSYTQLNVENNRNGIISENASSFTNFLEGTIKSSSVLDSICTPANAGATGTQSNCPTSRNLADRYYRTNEGNGYVQDKWQALSNLSITAGVRWDYHGGFTEKYGNFFNFDPTTYNVTGTDPGVGGTGFTVVNDGLVVAGNNPVAPTAGTTPSTLTGRQWGISPRIGFAWAPARDHGNFVVSGGAGIYYDRGEYFLYLSPPAGGGSSGPFGVTQQSPLVQTITGGGTTASKTLGTPLGSAPTIPAQPGVNPALQFTALQTQLNYMTGSTANYGLNCGGPGNLESQCEQAPLYISAYNKNNVLPYTINYTLKVQWQPRGDMSVTIGYTGNRGRHSVIPIPFNEPQIATASSPAMIGGASPHSSGETTSYGYDVLNSNTTCGKYKDPCSIASEPWSTYDGGNSDFRVAFPGYSPYDASFTTAGNSAYDALETHIEKRMSHNVLFGASYTFGHALDEQSDIGLFFTGNDPAHLRNSWASSDFDRNQVFTSFFLVRLPNATKSHNFESYFTNDWSLTGLATLQSGEPYSLYEYDGAVASAQLGYYPSLINPILPVANGTNPRSVLTGNPGRFRGPGGSYLPALDPSQIAIQYLQPGQNGVPTAAQGNPNDPVDAYETAFAPGNQRNIFRQAHQDRLDVSLRKEIRISDRLPPSLRLQRLQCLQPHQHGRSSELHPDRPEGRLPKQHSNRPGNRLRSFFRLLLWIRKIRYGHHQPADQAGTPLYGPPGGGTAGNNLFLRPYTNGTTGSATTIPISIPVGTANTPCTASLAINGNCANNGANFGSVTTVIGSARLITMDLHLVF